MPDILLETFYRMKKNCSRDCVILAQGNITWLKLLIYFYVIRLFFPLSANQNAMHLSMNQ